MGDSVTFGAPVPKSQWGRVQTAPAASSGPVPKDQWANVQPAGGSGQPPAGGGTPSQPQTQPQQPSTSSEYPEDQDMSDIARGAAHGALEGAGGLLSFVPDAYQFLYNKTAPYNILARSGIAPKKLNWNVGDHVENAINKVVSPPKTPLGNIVDFGTSMVSGAVLGSAVDRLLESGMSAAQIAARHTDMERAVVTDARAHGIFLSPKYIGGDISKAAQTMSGGPRVSQASSIKNIETVDNIAKAQLADTSVGRELGLDPQNMELAGPLSIYDKLKEAAYGKYKEAATSIGDIPQDATTKHLWDDYFEKVRAAGGRHARRLFSPFGKNIPTPIAMTKLQYLDPQGGQTADELMDEVRVLRTDAKANLSRADAEKNPVGKAQWHIAKAIDDLIGGYAEIKVQKGELDPATFKSYLDARQDLAVINTYEGSTAPSGHIIAKALGKAIKSKDGRSFTGGLQKIGTWAAMFPDDFQPMYEKGEQGMFSAVDYLLGGSGIIFNHPVEAGLAILRPIARKAVTTKAVQDAMAARYSGSVPFLNKGFPLGAAAGGLETAKDVGSDDNQ